MFEDSLLELDEKRKKKSGAIRFIVLPLAILIHLAAAGAFLFANYWQVDPVPEPPINVVFFSAAAPTASSASPASGRQGDAEGGGPEGHPGDPADRACAAGRGA